MANPEQPIPLGTEQLRTLTAGARAQHRAAPTMIVAPPPDERASPWNRGLPPQPQVVAREEVERAHDSFTPPSIKRSVSGTQTAKTGGAGNKTPAPPPPARGSKATNGFKMVNQLLKTWHKKAEHSIPQANAEFAKELMFHGALLIADAYPLDSLSTLVALSKNLLAASQDDESADVNTEAIRKAMEREYAPPEQPEESEEREDDGEQ